MSNVATLSRSRRLLVAGLGFVLFEALFIWAFGEKIYDHSYFSPVMWGLIVLPGAGYFGLGFFSRSWLSAFLLVVPLLVAFYFVHVVWTYALEGGGTLTVNASFAEIWLTLSLIFIPAWAIGVVFARRSSRQD